MPNNSEIISRLLKDPRSAQPLSGGYSNLSIYLYDDGVLGVSTNMNNPKFDSITTYIALNFLKRSKYSTSNCGVAGYEAGIRTPGLFEVREEKFDKNNFIIYKIYRCCSEKLYNLLIRTRKMKKIEDVIDETNTLINSDTIKRIPFIKSININDLMEQRRSTAISFYTHLTEVVKDIPTNINSTSLSFNGNGFDYLLEKRIKSIKNHPLFNKYKKTFNEKKDILCLELLIELHEIENSSTYSLKQGIKTLRENIQPYLTELSELTKVNLTEKDLVIFHDDNNKNVLVGSDIYKKLNFYYIDFHRLMVGNEMENWYSQVIYPGQYIDMPYVLHDLKKNDLKKELDTQINGVQNQINDYIHQRFKISNKDKKWGDLSIKSYGILIKWALRDTGIFYSFGEKELSEGFMQYAIDCAAIINNTNHHLKNLLPTLIKTYSILFGREYIPTERKI